MRACFLRMVWMILALSSVPAMQGVAAEAVPDVSARIAALEAQNEQLRTLVPSQSHAMIDVAYHFTNLWFAGAAANWPLAQFYFNETRNHILWAIRLVPVRKVSSGELHLQDVFDGFDKSQLTELKQQITAHSREKFEAAYRSAAAGCSACHAAAEKPYLRVVVPQSAEVQVIDFREAASVR